jgi:hypothetical protein
MTTSHPAIHLGHGPLQAPAARASGGHVTLSGGRYSCIRHVDAMPPFLMSIVSASDLWLFVSSSGGLTAGRVDADRALFPYITDDKLTESFEHSGPKTVLRVTRSGRRSLWEPFSDRGRGIYRVERTLFKHVLGHEVLFEEINHDLGLAFGYGWRASDAFGFVRTAWLSEAASAPCSVSVLDGLQNLLPAGVSAALQGGMSNLVDAYKRSELEPGTGLGLFTLSSITTDRAEPSESLRATTVFALGLAGADHLLSSAQLERFRLGEPPLPEVDVRGRRGAYLVHDDVALGAGETRRWRIVADVGADHARVVALVTALGGARLRATADGAAGGAADDAADGAAGGAADDAADGAASTDRADDAEAVGRRLDEDLLRSDEALEAIVASADGFQWTADEAATDHHLASVLFNLMRGGVFVADERVTRSDLIDFVATRNRAVLTAHGDFFDALPDTVAYRDLVSRAAETGEADLERLCRSYLPLAFSRRHGDPSRPWNRFTINVRNPDGRLRLDYQGNWRDIFQNWEALAHAFPGFVTGMITVFLSATTADGYNPYRVTRDGIEWEAPEAGQTWANIGYWSDHQVIYLQKLLEVAERFDPDALDGLLQRRVFSHANVPYRIASYRAMLADPYDTIEFDGGLHRRIVAAVIRDGTDARLVHDRDGATLHVSMAEKLLVLLLVKLANLVPEGGIWMNTQRPEWNDANNALVGKGLSVVTTAYLYRTVVFLQRLCDGRDVTVSHEVRTFLDAVEAGLRLHEPSLAGGFDDRRRMAFMDALGAAGSVYRRGLYESGLSGAQDEIGGASLAAFLELARRHLEHTLRANRRSDALYHAYNVLALDGGRAPGEAAVAADGQPAPDDQAALAGRATIRHLDEMLEGQVAILSSGLLATPEALELLASLRASRLYRADQHSYVLYPDRDLPGFLAKNRIARERLRDSALLSALVERGDTRIVVRDAEGDAHFHGDFRNATDVRRALADLARDERWAELVADDGDAVAALFEALFDHASFTGRSGTFFAYEGLGSIYWHMVSKLLLAVQEVHARARAAGEPAAHLQALAAAYHDVRDGLGFNKAPAEFGAFPADPYSHTPAHAGAQQPGMTGQVKEDVLARWGELGVEVQGGRLGFAPSLLRRAEFLEEATAPVVRSVGGAVTLPLERGTLGFTFCQVPVVYRLVDDGHHVAVVRRDGSAQTFTDGFLDRDTSREVFERRGSVERITVAVPASALVGDPGTQPRVRTAIGPESSADPRAPTHPAPARRSPT